MPLTAPLMSLCQSDSVPLASTGGRCRDGRGFGATKQRRRRICRTVCLCCVCCGRLGQNKGAVKSVSRFSNGTGTLFQDAPIDSHAAWAHSAVRAQWSHKSWMCRPPNLLALCLRLVCISDFLSVSPAVLQRAGAADKERGRRTRQWRATVLITYRSNLADDWLKMWRAALESEWERGDSRLL